MSAFSTVKELQVSRRLSDGCSVPVGRLAQNQRAVYFQYDAEYLLKYNNLSPFGLSFDSSLQQAPSSPHKGLQGVFADSLPDGWGMLLMDRVFRQRGISPQQLTALDRLAYIGNRGMGALEYSPVSDYAPDDSGDLIDLSVLGREAEQVFSGDYENVIQQLANGGSSGGARPKAQVYLAPDGGTQVSTLPLAGYEPWLIKFTSSSFLLGHEEGVCEAAYLTLAANAGIDVPEWRLFSAPEQSGASQWLGVRRFDCKGEAGRFHVHSLCGLLDADFRMPSLDYEEILKASQVLCQRPEVGQQQFRRAVFNLLACNQDDHSKNWAFMMDDKGEWRPSPFYDITFCPTPYREHISAFMGYGKQPPVKAMQSLARQANFSNWKQAQEVIQEVFDVLQGWHDVAMDLGVKPQTAQLIAKHLEQVWWDNRGLLKL